MDSEKDKCVKAIGGIVLNFARLEMEFKHSICFISEIEVENNEIFTAKLSFNNTLDLFSDFSISKFKEEKEKIEKLKALLKDARGANEMRNDIMHSYWFENPTDPINPLFKHKMRKRLKGVYSNETVPYGYAELEKVAIKINETYDHLMRFMKEHFDS